MDMHFRFDPLDSADVGLHGARADAIGAKWRALHDAAEAIASVARMSGYPARPLQQDFAEAIVALGGWRLAQAQQGLDDLVAIMEPGLEALLTLHLRGADCTAAALALGKEFEAARDSLLDLVPWQMEMDQA